MIRVMIPGLLMALLSCQTADEPGAQSDVGYVEFKKPKHYICERIGQVTVDGRLDEWEEIAWTDNFLDIEGSDKPEPRFKTRAKMAWDETHLYIAAELEEPHVWATLKQRDTIIFYDNDFEVFIDPDGDTHHYYELEINAFKTAWDLLLTMPYRDFGHVIDSWDIIGLQVGVQVNGTLNDPSDTDQSWTVELALPFSVLEECSSRDGLPAHGDVWRINFSRVQWQTDIVNGRYVKRKNPETGKNLPEDNWVWTPQYHINMHMPEYWGYMVFSTEAGKFSNGWKLPADERIKWSLRNVYYMQNAYYSQHGSYAGEAALIGYPTGNPDLTVPDIMKTMTGYQAAIQGESGYWVINEHGWLRKIAEMK